MPSEEKFIDETIKNAIASAQFLTEQPMFGQEDSDEDEDCECVDGDEECCDHEDEDEDDSVTESAKDHSDKEWGQDANGKGNIIPEPIDTKKSRKEKNKVKTDESIESLFLGKDLSEDFKLETATLFEAHLESRVSEIEEELTEQFAQLLETHTVSVTEEMVTRIDQYLEYVVEEWVKDNKLAIQNGLRTEVTEGFIERLRDVFNESYIDIPEEKLDLFETTIENLESVKEELDEQVETNLELITELNQYKCEVAFQNNIEGLTTTDIEKLKTLSESISFDSPEEFEQKLTFLKENVIEGTNKANAPIVAGMAIRQINEQAARQKFVRSAPQVRTPSPEETFQDEEPTTPLMEAYMKSMTKATY